MYCDSLFHNSSLNDEERSSGLIYFLLFISLDLDYSILRNDLEFRSNTPEVGLDISIDIMHDLLVEGLEVVYLSLTQPVIIGLTSDGAVIGSHQNAIIFIRDDDGLRKYFLCIQCHNYNKYYVTNIIP